MSNDKLSTPIDTAHEPVDPVDDGEFMDTGVLHETPRTDPERSTPDHSDTKAER